MIRRLVAAACIGALPLVLAAQAPAPAGARAEADRLLHDGRYAEARLLYREAIGTPPDTRAAAGAVLAALRAGDTSGALADAGGYRRSFPDDAAVAAMYGDALWAAGLFDEADAAYRDALGLDPAEPRAHHGQARLLAAVSRLDDALDEVREAERLDPDEPEFHGTAGSLLQRLHRYADASAELKAYLDLLPRGDRSERTLWARDTIRLLDAFGRRTPFDFGTDGARTWTVPIRVDGDKVFVAGRINGRPQEFILDTGAEQTVVSRDVARRTGIVPITYMETAGVGGVGFRGLQVGRIDTLQIGSLTVRNIPGLIKNPPLADVPKHESESFSPIALGLSMRVDYARGELRMAQALPPATGAVQLPLRMYRLATVRGTINGAPAPFVVDTGGEVLSISGARAARLPAGSGRRIPLKVYGTSGWDRNAFLMPDVSIAFDTLRFDPMPVVVLDLGAPSALLGYELGGIVGHRVLSKYVVTLDLKRSVMVLE